MAEELKNERIKVKVYDADYYLKANRDNADYLQKIAMELDEKMEQVHKTIKYLNGKEIAVLVALNLLDELHESKSKYEELMRVIKLESKH
ncbi:MAG: cell division protein ZapA [Clostridia bacterium]